MKVEKRINNVEYSHNFETTRFQIDASAKAFELISKNLYKRPINAIIRELSANAVDSHVKAGKPDEIFDITFPTKLNNNFVIRDYGVGLTPEEIEELYTVVFRSDKTSSNEFHGAFGVGSKTPFAYTDSFIVESYVDGKKWVYSVHLDEERCPAISKMHEAATDEKNGVKISFPVKNSDIHTFVQAGKSELKHFSPKPNSNITIDAPYDEESVLFDNGEVVAFRGGVRRSDNVSISVLMGNIEYEIALSNVGSDLDPEVRSFLETAMDWRRSYSFILRAGIGDINPAASREYAQVDDKLINFINEKIAKFCEDYTSHVKETVIGPIDDVALLREFSINNNLDMFKVITKNDNKKIKEFFDNVDYTVAAKPREYSKDNPNIPEWAFEEFYGYEDDNRQRYNNIYVKNIIRFSDIPSDLGIKKTKIIRTSTGSHTLNDGEEIAGCTVSTAFPFNINGEFPVSVPSNYTVNSFALVDEKQALISRTRNFFTRHDGIDAPDGKGKIFPNRSLYVAIYCDEDKFDETKQWLEENIPNAIVEKTSNMPWESDSVSKKKSAPSSYAEANYCRYDYLMQDWKPISEDELPAFSYYCYVNSRSMYREDYFKKTEPNDIDTRVDSIHNYTKIFQSLKVPVIGVKRDIARSNEHDENMLYEVPENWKPIEQYFTDLDDFLCQMNFDDFDDKYAVFKVLPTGRYLSNDDVVINDDVAVRSMLVKFFFDAYDAGYIDEIPETIRKCIDNSVFNYNLATTVGKYNSNYYYNSVKYLPNFIEKVSQSCGNISTSGYFYGRHFNADTCMLLEDEFKMLFAYCIGSPSSAIVDEEGKIRDKQLKYFAEYYNEMCA